MYCKQDDDADTKYWSATNHASGVETRRRLSVEHCRNWQQKHARTPHKQRPASQQRLPCTYRPVTDSCNIITITRTTVQAPANTDTNILLISSWQSIVISTSVCDHISGTTCAIFTNFSVHVAYRCGSVLYYANFNTLTLPELHTYQILKFVHNCVYHQNKLPSMFSNDFIQNYMIHIHNTRSREHLHLQHTQSFLGQRSLKFKGSCLWNSLPDELKPVISARPRSWSMESIESIKNRPSRVDKKIIA